MRLAWLTDIHLEFVASPAIEQLWQSVRQSGAEAVVVGGDICAGSRLQSELGRMEKILARPIYFVLGNHDFYSGSLSKVRESIAALSGRSKWLKWLVTAGIVPLTARTGLLGHDSWADGRLGDFAHSDVRLNDYIYIKELSGLKPDARLAKLNALGDEAAAYFARVLPEALQRFEKVVLLTHAPPFESACWYEGRISDKNYLPHFACKAVGDVLVRIMRDLPNRELLVLCGHTHGAGECQVLPNLLVKTGGAEYRRPQMQDLLTVD
ncbi:MAG TPA: metallophosphoesterase [Terriglobia bacterium]|nr:metallophosphoesterase [Terriglobia bacterium]